MSHRSSRQTKHRENGIVKEVMCPELKRDLQIQRIYMNQIGSKKKKEDPYLRSSL
jgi:hypothetical protein